MTRLRAIFRLDEGWLTFILLCLTVYSVVWSVQDAEWVEGLDILTWTTLSALVCGLLFAKLRWPETLLHALAAMGGATIIIHFVGSVLPEGYWQERTAELWSRTVAWWEVTQSGGIATDNLLFLFMLAALGWLIAYMSAWTIFRYHGAWWTLVSSGTALVVNLSYAYTLTGYLLLFMLSATLLIVCLNAYTRQRAWRAEGMGYSAGFSWLLVRSSLLVLLPIILFAWLMPRNISVAPLMDAWPRLSSPWEDLQSEFARRFGGVISKSEPTFSGFTDAMVLRGSFNLASNIVMTVKSAEGHYWRGMVYERYTGNGFMAADKRLLNLLPGDPRVADVASQYEMREEVVQEFSMVRPRGNLVFAAAQPKALSIPTIGEVPLAALKEGNPVDMGVLQSTTRSALGSYTVVSSVSVADVASLRGAGTNYPDWVRRLYLPLPRTVPARVTALSLQLTSPYDNIYDKATAIEGYLRTFEYTLQISPPPSGRDGVDYLLFETQKGYCDYFASAMVVMLRSVGVPARVAAGYAVGEYDSDRNLFVVRDSNAHSWVEVFFPRYGWVEFEPSPSRPRFERPPVPGEESASTESATTPSEPQPDQFPEDEGTDVAEAPVVGGSGSFWWPWALVAAILVVVYLAGRYLWQRSYADLSVAEALHAQMCLIAGWAGFPHRHHQTPYEYARQLGEAVPQGRESIVTITNAYVRYRFAHQRLLAIQEEWLAALWGSLRGKLLWAMLRSPSRVFDRPQRKPATPDAKEAGSLPQARE